MYSMYAIAHPAVMPETETAEVAHQEAVARLAGLVVAMTALDRRIERCTDPLAESCLLTLRAEHEVLYLETLYGWQYESSGDPVLQ